MEKLNIYLWVIGEGWKLFKISRNSEELTSRNIKIGNSAKIGNYA